MVCRFRGFIWTRHNGENAFCVGSGVKCAIYLPNPKIFTKKPRRVHLSEAYFDLVVSRWIAKQFFFVDYIYRKYEILWNLYITLTFHPNSLYFFNKISFILVSTWDKVWNQQIIFWTSRTLFTKFCEWVQWHIINRWKIKQKNQYIWWKNILKKASSIVLRRGKLNVLALGLALFLFLSNFLILLIIIFEYIFLKPSCKFNCCFVYIHNSIHNSSKVLHQNNMLTSQWQL